MIHENNRAFRYILIALLLILALLSVYAAFVISGIYSFVLIAITPGLLIIRFKKAEMGSDKVLYTDRSVLPFLNEEKVIYFNSISSLEIYPGYFDKQFFLFDIFFSTGGARGNTRPARITFRFDNNQAYSIVQFGKKKEFDNLTNRIEKAYNSSQSKFK